MQKLKIIFFSSLKVSLAIGLLFWYLHSISCTSIIYTFVNSFLIAILTIVSPLSSPEMTFHNVNRFSALLSTTASRSYQGETMSYHYGIVTLNSSSLISSSYQGITVIYWVTYVRHVFEKKIVTVIMSAITSCLMTKKSLMKVKNANNKITSILNGVLNLHFEV